MKKKTAIVYFILIHVFCFGQTGSLENDIPQEKIFAHINTTFLLTGETLYYKLYCINSLTKKLSNLSKVAYVELINEEKKSVVKHKLRLKKGQSYGDFFVPSSLGSGNYKLIAYTQWMRNKNLFYQNDLLIVNPFNENQSKIINPLGNETLESEDESDPELIINKINKKEKSTYISLKSNSDSYKPREKVALQITSLQDERSYGDYSISVKRNSPIKVPEVKTSYEYNEMYNAGSNTSNQSSFFIPELRGELIEGVVLDKKNNKPVPNVIVAISISGVNSLFKASSTNKNGRFYFNIHEDYENNSAIIQAVDYIKADYDIQIKKETPIDYGQFKFNKFYINEKDKDFILKKSINNQIENSYKSVKKDSIKKLQNIAPFYGSLAIEYYLDDYKRFPTLKETFVEVIEKAWISSKEENYSFEVKSSLNGINYQFPALLLVDGVLIKNHNDIIDYEAKKIKKISVVRDQYIYGPLIFNGVIFIETKDGDFKNLQSKSKEIKLFKSYPVKTYFSPDYSDGKNYSRIPDYRNQLLWLPDLSVDKKDKSLYFYTSDISGSYEISLEGFTNEGKPVSVKKTITVE